MIRLSPYRIFNRPGVAGSECGGPDQTGNVGNIGKLGTVGKVGKVGKVQKVGKLLM